MNGEHARMAPLSRYALKRRCPGPPPFGVMSWEGKRSRRAERLHWKRLHDQANATINELVKQAAEAAEEKARVAANQAIAKWQAFRGKVAGKLARFFTRRG